MARKTTFRTSTPSKKGVRAELNKEHCRLETLGPMTDSGRALLSDMSLSGFVVDDETAAAFGERNDGGCLLRYAERE